MSVFDRLDSIANEMRYGNFEKGKERMDVLSKAESFYVSLAANRPDLCPNDSISYMLKRMGQDWVAVLIERHQYD